MSESLISNANRDELPFVEKYRPDKLSKIISHDNIVSTLQSYLVNGINRIPHLLLYGPPGTGKTSMIEAFVAELYGMENKPYMVMIINASEARGIDVVRNKIDNFVGNKSLCTGDVPPYKFVILDEADAVTNEAQNMLRIVIEENVENARFCLICNSLNKINLAIQSRCQKFKFKPLDYDSVIEKIDNIARDNNVRITESGKKTIWKLSKGDMRYVMHMLQVISINNEKITEKTVTEFLKYPKDSESDKLYKKLTGGKTTLQKNYELIQIEISKGYRLRDIMTEMFIRVSDNMDKFTNEQMIKFYSDLRDIEVNVLQTGDSITQIAAFAATFIELN